MTEQEVKSLLDEKYEEYNTRSFIDPDPITIPHQYSKKQDIEISGFFAATLAWGQRKTIITKCQELMTRMDNSPYDFILNHSDDDLKTLSGFKHRTFNYTDLLYFIEFFKAHYSLQPSLESAFSNGQNQKERLSNFHRKFFDLPYSPDRTRKHVSTPERKSACKRLNMYLRWMVRNDHTNVDFGLWPQINASDLICPLDVHVSRTARKLGLLSRKQDDWLAAVELTNNLKTFDPDDPVKYDYALFGLGVFEKF